MISYAIRSAVFAVVRVRLSVRHTPLFCLNGYLKLFDHMVAKSF